MLERPRCSRPDFQPGVYKIRNIEGKPQVTAGAARLASGANLHRLHPAVELASLGPTVRGSAQHALSGEAGELYLCAIKRSLLIETIVRKNEYPKKNLYENTAKKKLSCHRHRPVLHSCPSRDLQQEYYA